MLMVKLSKVPIVFVHGYMTGALSNKPIADNFRQNYGYTDAEIYATTYGSTGSMFPVQTAMACEYVKLVSYLFCVFLDLLF